MMTTTYHFDQIIDRRADSIKWRAYGPDVLPLWVADMDFTAPEPVIHALHERVEHGIFGYPDDSDNSPTDLPSLRQLIVERMARLYHWQITPEDVVLTPGVVVGFHIACYALAGMEAGVLIQTPVYPPILHAAQTTGCIYQETELSRQADGSYSVDWQSFEENITPQTRIFLLCNPHNPVGKVFQRQELERMAEICLRHKIAICSDEIHCDLVYPGHPHTPIASLAPEIARNSITLMAPSKTFNIAGLQCSIAIIPDPDLRKSYAQARKGLAPWVNLLGVTAARAAYQHGQEWLDQLLVYLKGNRDFICHYVQQELPHIQMGLPEGTYLAWLDCRHTGIEGNPYQFFLEKAHLAFNDGATFGKGGEGFIRLNFGCPRSILEQALERIKNALPK